jgi:hypothetical protein
VIETAMVSGILLLAIVEFSSQNAVHSIAILTVFLAASSRIAPALLRIQQNLIGIRNSAGISESTLQLIEKINKNNNKIRTSQ